MGKCLEIEFLSKSKTHRCAKAMLLILVRTDFSVRCLLFQRERDRDRDRDRERQREREDAFMKAIVT